MRITRYVSRITTPATLVGLFLFATAAPAQLQFNELTPLPPHADVTQAVAMGDVDGDGDLDLVFGNEPGDPYYGTEGGNRLYLNDGSGMFTDVTEARLPPGGGVSVCRGVGSWGSCYGGEYANSVTLGDVDLDGDLDILFLNQLCVNDGTGTFTDATASHLPSSYGSYASSVALGDVDGDGDLDALLGRRGGYSAYCEEPYYDSCWGWLHYWEHPEPNLLYLNDGTGAFVEAPAGRLPGHSDWTTSVALDDVDADGDLDAVIANGVWTVHRITGLYSEQEQYGPNRLYLNDGNGVFTDAIGQLPSDPGWSTALALGDVELDGDLDLLFVSDGLKLSLNDGSGTFTDATAERLPSGAIGNCVSVASGDVDLDGDPDLVVGNGGQNWVYLNDGTGTFVDATAARMPIDSDYTEAVALGDADGDGDLDLVFGNSDQNRVEANLLRHLDVPFPVMLGQPYQLDVYARYGPPRSPGVTTDTAVVMLSAGTAQIPLPPFGTLGLDPTQLLALPAFAIPQPDGVASISLPVPNDPRLVGQSIYAQAFLVQAFLVQNPFAVYLTNWTGDVIMQ